MATPAKPSEPVVIWLGSSSSGMLKAYMGRITGERLKPVYKKVNLWFRADWISNDIESGQKDKFEAMMATAREAFTKAGKVDFGILQLSGGIISRSPATEKNVPQVLDAMCELIREAGAQPVIFEHWTARDQPKVRAYAIEAARRNGARVAFCGSAFHEVAADKGGVKEGSKYLGSLSMHTGPRGLYLATCCMYATLTGLSPVGLPLPDPKAGAVEIPKPGAGQLGGDGPATPEAEPAASSGAQDTVITAQDAEYLQKKAWEVQQKYSAWLVPASGGHSPE